jgi:hypothetical protein
MFWTPKKKALDRMHRTEGTDRIVHDSRFKEVIMEIPHVIWAGDYGPGDALVKQSPYQVGMHLWVKETWTAAGYDGRIPSEIPQFAYIRYKATESRVDDSEYNEVYKWRTSLFMCRWMSRLALEILSVEAEQIQDITEEDAQSEGAPLGCAGSDCAPGQCLNTYRLGFHKLWDSLYGNKPGYSWSSNPWVWKLTFRLIQLN